MAFGGPLILVWNPIMYMFLAIVSLSQFKIAYSLLMRAAAGKASNDVLAALQATLKQHLAFAESIFGQPHTFTPSATHVLLVAIMICLLANRR